jgi:hypothetical protein
VTCPWIIFLYPRQPKEFFNLSREKKNSWYFFASSRKALAKIKSHSYVCKKDFKLNFEKNFVQILSRRKLSVNITWLFVRKIYWRKSIIFSIPKKRIYKKLWEWMWLKNAKIVENWLIVKWKRLTILKIAVAWQ